MTKFFAAVCLVWVGMSQISYAQVYANEQLRIETENRDAAKGKGQINSPGYTQGAEKQNADISGESGKEVRNESPNMPLPDVSQYYKVASIRIAEQGRKLSDDEKLKWQKEADSEFGLNCFYISVSEKKLIRQNRQSGAYTVYEISSDGNSIKIECEKCNTPPFRLVEFTSQKLVFAEKSQDEGADFEFIYTFKK